MAIFPREPELAGTRMSPFWILLDLRMMEVQVTTGAIRRAKLQSNCHHQQTNTQPFTWRMPFLSANHQCHSTEGESQKSLLFCIVTHYALFTQNSTDKVTDTQSVGYTTLPTVFCVDDNVV